jgi:chromosome segregation ATPase
MKNFNPLVIAAFLLCAMSLWGCGQQKPGAITAKIRDLENRYAKLEEDYRALQATSEQNRKRLGAVEAQRAELEKDKAELTKELQGTAEEREALKKQVAQAKQERDAAQGNLVQFSRDLQTLAGRVEAAANNAPANPNTAIIPASRRTE